LLAFIKKFRVEKSTWISISIITGILFVLFSRFVFLGLEPAGVDVIASLGSTNQMKAWQDESGETALWNPSIFGGMPAYPRKIPQLILPDTIISKLNFLLDWRFLYMLAGGLGLFSLLKYKKLPWYWSLVAALAFILLPHWQALIEVGHNTKFRAFMVIPWFVLAFHYFFDRNSWFSAGLFAVVFAWLIRTQHIQVVFYALLLLIALFIYPYIRLWIEKSYQKATGLLIKLFVAIILTIMTAAAPFLTLQEYTPYSTRGGNALVMDENKAAKQGSGVDFDYATQWSLAPKEILSFWYPRFFGGYSSEIYDGNQFPQLRGRQIPGYWGDMPFTQSYDSMGMILFLFALIGFWYYRKEPFVMGLAAFSIFSVFLAFGKHFPMLYHLFFDYVPYFSKFRVPSMIVNVTFTVLIIASAYGLNALTTMVKEKDRNLVLGILGSGAALTVLLLLFKGSFAYVAAREAGQYQGETLQMIRLIREEILTRDLIKTLLFVLLGGSAVTAWFFKKMKTTILIAVLSLAIFGELFTITWRANQNMVLQNKAAVEYQTFADTKITNFLKNQKKDARLLALGREFQSNYYGYFYPTINGYSAIKMQLIQDIIEHSLQSGGQAAGLNWNVVNMLGGKYIVASSALNAPFLQKRVEDERRKEILFENTNALPKAWFVGQIQPLENDAAVVKAMNSAEFNPEATAYTLEQIESKNYSGQGAIKILRNNPNELHFQVKITEPQLAVFSEVFYPGWKLFDSEGNEFNIFRVNHILRSAELPAGEYELTMRFESRAYRLSRYLTWMGNFLALLLIVGGLYQRSIEVPTK
jgi:hypothetical protein